MSGSRLNAKKCSSVLERVASARSRREVNPVIKMPSVSVNLMLLGAYVHVGTMVTESQAALQRQVSNIVCTE